LSKHFDIKEQVVQAVFYTGSKHAVVSDIPKPEPESGQVLIEMRAAGICGSDVHVFRLPEAELSKQPRSRLVPGHEASGIVHAVGDGVTNLKIGDPVLVYHYTGCYRCRECLSGYIYRCSQAKAHGRELNGALAEFLLTEAVSVLPVPDWMSFEEAAVAACAGGTAFNAVGKLRLSGPSSVIVSGLGPVGLSAALICSRLGVDVVGIDTNANRRELAWRLGIKHLIDSSSSHDFAPADGVIETSGSASVQEKLCSWIRPGGKGVLVGIGHWKATFTAFEMIRREVTLQPSKIFPIQTVHDLFGFLSRTGLRLGSMITHRFPLSRVQEGYTVAEQGLGGKVIIEWKE
jgi:D-arabinose 1-dehydrogenase-like Zn-dependent alcohol dehydrogenase